MEYTESDLDSQDFKAPLNTYMSGIDKIKIVLYDA